MTKIPRGSAPSGAFQLYRELGISSVTELSAAIDEGQLRDLRGFRPEERGQATATGSRLSRSLGQRVPAERRLRRRRGGSSPRSALCRDASGASTPARCGGSPKTIGDVDILAAASDSGPLMRALLELPACDTRHRAGRGEDVGPDQHRPSRARAAASRFDLRVVPLACWGAALQYFTGLAGTQCRDPRDGRAARS